MCAQENSSQQSLLSLILPNNINNFAKVKVVNISTFVNNNSINNITWYVLLTTYQFCFTHLINKINFKCLYKNRNYYKQANFTIYFNFSNIENWLSYSTLKYNKQQIIVKYNKTSSNNNIYFLFVIGLQIIVVFIVIFILIVFFKLNKSIILYISCYFVDFQYFHNNNKSQNSVNLNLTNPNLSQNSVFSFKDNVILFFTLFF